MCPLELPIFLQRPTTELTLSTRQAVCALNQSILWDVYELELLLLAFLAVILPSVKTAFNVIVFLWKFWDCFVTLFIYQVFVSQKFSLARFFKIRLGLYSKKFQKCLINYLGLGCEQTVTSQLYLLVNHHRDCSSLLQSLCFYYNLYDIHEKFEFICDVTNKAHPHPLLACLLCLKGPPFLY
jgi:hypothetical protein